MFCFLFAATKALSAAQIQVYRQQQALLRQQQQQLRVLQSRSATVAGPKVSVAVCSSPATTQRGVQQVFKLNYI